MRRRSLGLFALMALCAAGCCGPSQAERDTYALIGPAHRAYVQADPQLDDDQKARRIRTVETWRVRVGGSR